MYCVRCGNQLQAGAAICPNCGAPTGMGAASTAAPPLVTVDPAARFRRHLKLIGAFWIAYSVLGILVGIGCLIAGVVLMPAIAQRAEHALFVPYLLFGIGAVMLLKTLIGAAAGAALLQARPWARIVILIYSFLALLNFPLGTALGVYSLVVLLPEEGERYYSALSRELEP
jgi:hypothetical protein